MSLYANSSRAAPHENGVSQEKSALLAKVHAVSILVVGWELLDFLIVSLRRSQRKKCPTNDGRYPASGQAKGR